MSNPQARLAALSAREREMLALILTGKRNKVGPASWASAGKLGISMRTMDVRRAPTSWEKCTGTAVEPAAYCSEPPARQAASAAMKASRRPMYCA